MGCGSSRPPDAAEQTPGVGWNRPSWQSPPSEAGSTSDSVADSPIKNRKVAQWYDTLCTDGSSSVRVAAFGDPALCKAVYRTGLKPVKLMGRAFTEDSELGDTLSYQQFADAIEFWTTATLERKMVVSFYLFANDGEDVVSKDRLGELLHHIFPVLSRAAVNDIGAAISLAAEVGSILIRGVHKQTTDVTEDEFVSWMWRCQFTPRLGCDSGMLSLDWSLPQRRNTWETTSSRSNTRSVTIKVVPALSPAPAGPLAGRAAAAVAVAATSDLGPGLGIASRKSGQSAELLVVPEAVGSGGHRSNREKQQPEQLASPDGIAAEVHDLPRPTEEIQYLPDEDSGASAPTQVSPSPSPSPSQLQLQGGRQAARQRKPRTSNSTHYLSVRGSNPNISLSEHNSAPGTAPGTRPRSYHSDASGSDRRGSLLPDGGGGGMGRKRVSTRAVCGSAPSTRPARPSNSPGS